MENDELHLDPKPLLEHLGFPDTEQNRLALIDALKLFVRKELPRVPIVDVFDREDPPA